MADHAPTPNLEDNDIVDLHPGFEVRANVKLLEPLREGGMGAVWVAEHESLGTKVAVKVISEKVGDNAEVRERFTREAMTAARIKSPHVVQTLDHGVMADGRAYIVMELLEGQDVLDKLEAEGRLSLRDVASVVTQAASALEAAHKIGVVHRDIKPDNIYLCEQDEGDFFVKVLDFGIAKAAQLPSVTRLTRPGQMLGTPEYMSPEQVLCASPVDKSADVWGLTVVAYSMLTGALPFTGNNIGELCANLLRGGFEPPSAICEELGDEVDEFFVKALHTNKSKRYPGAKLMAEALVRALSRVSLLPDPSQQLQALPDVALSGPMVGSALSAGTIDGAETLIRAPSSEPSSSRVYVAAVVVALLVAGTVGVMVSRDRLTVPFLEASPATAPATAAEDAPSVLDDALPSAAELGSAAVEPEASAEPEVVAEPESSAEPAASADDPEASASASASAAPKKAPPRRRRYTPRPKQRTKGKARNYGF